eukprot:scaffold3867_cov160-Isochrysis_galbana.AAC.5
MPLVGDKGRRGVGRHRGGRLASPIRGHLLTQLTHERHIRALSESALSGGRSPVWPWTGACACRLASCVPGASCSRAWVWSIGGSVMIALHVFVVVCAPTR